MRHMHFGALHLVAGRMASSRRSFHFNLGRGHILVIVRGVVFGAVL